MPSSRRAIAERLRAIVAAEKISDAEFCRRAGIKTTAWANFTSPNQKRVITWKAADKICDEFNVTMDFIYRGRARFISAEILAELRKSEAA